jgi:predicted nucleic acid-binding protein
LRLVVDASVAVKWLLNEPDSELAEVLLTSGARLVAPDLIIPEAANVAWKAWRRGQLDGNACRVAMDRLPRLLSAVFPSGPLAPRAAELACSLNHPAYDCFYLALAEREGSTLVSADARLARTVRGSPWQGAIVDLAGGVALLS